MPRIVDHDAQREEMLGKSFELFADRGYAALSMRQLAQGLSVSTGTLYHYFPSKEAIFEQMVGWIAARDVLEATADIPVDATAERKLEMVFAWIQVNRSYLQKMLLLVFDFQRHRNDPQARSLVAAATSQYRLTLTEMTGCGNVGWSLVLGMLIQGLLEDDTLDPAEHLAALAMLRGTGP